MSLISHVRPHPAAKASLCLRSLQSKPQLHSLRSREYQPKHITLPQTRGFHLGLVAASDAILHNAQSGLIAVHALTGLPWVLIIPSFAVSMALVFRLPFTAYSRLIQQRRRRLEPALQGWANRLYRDAARNGISDIRSSLKTVSKRIYGKAGVGDGKAFLSVIGLLPWLFGIEIVRRISGGRVGLLGMMLGSETADATKKGADMVAAEGNGESLTSNTATSSSVTSGDPAMVDAVASSTPDAASILAQSGIEPSMATEGALWFTDLTVADPCCILPVALSAILVANVLPKNKESLKALFNSSQPADDSARNLDRVRLQGDMGLKFQRFLLCLSLAVAPATMNLPAAVHLYWISSSSFQLLVSSLLKKAMPIKGGQVMPCETQTLPLLRPTRERKKQQKGLKDPVTNSAKAKI